MYEAKYPEVDDVVMVQVRGPSRPIASLARSSGTSEALVSAADEPPAWMACDSWSEVHTQHLAHDAAVSRAAGLSQCRASAAAR